MDDPPYTPGAGKNELDPLPDREDILDQWSLMLVRVQRRGRSAADDYVLTGYRGVGKSVTQQQAVQRAAEIGYERVAIQANSDTPLATAIMNVARTKAAEQATGSAWRRGLDALSRINGVSAGFAGVQAQITLGERTDRSTEPAAASLYDPTALGSILATLSRDIRRPHDRGGIVLAIDELQMTHPATCALSAAC